MSADPSSPPFSDIRPSTSDTEPAVIQPRPRAFSGGMAARRRRVPDSVTPNACTNCKKARAKCDGVKPACKRCVTRHVPDECHYEVHAKTAKEQMVREIQCLQQRNESLEEEKGSLVEKNHWIERIMGSLADDGHETEIVRRLKRGESHKTIAEWLGRPLQNLEDLSPASEIELVQAIERYHQNLVKKQDPRYWTNATQDVPMIEHLVALYFTWIHPAHMLFNEDLFMTSFRGCSDTYCSMSLVNAICAVSCSFLYRKSDQDPDPQDNIDSLRSKFLSEVFSHQKEADYSKMTVIQTYAVVFLAELGSCNAPAATFHLRLAAESLTAKQHGEQTGDSEEITARGILTLHTAWSGLLYQKPTTPLSIQSPSLQEISLDHTDDLWCFYRQPVDANLSRRPCYSQLSAIMLARLYRIIHNTVLDFCGHKGTLNAHTLVARYDRYLRWKDELPDVLRDVERDAEALPHILFLHVQYHTALVHLLHPLLYLENTQSSYEYLKDLLIRQARDGFALIVQHQHLYTFMYQSPLQLPCFVHLCDVLVQYDRQNPATPDIIRFCFESLEEAKASYSIAGPLQQMFRLSLAEYNVPVPSDLHRLIGHASRYGPEDFLNTCTRASYRQPINQLLPNLDPALGMEFVQESQRIEEDGFMSSQRSQDSSQSQSESRKQSLMRIESVLNT